MKIYYDCKDCVNSKSGSVFKPNPLCSKCCINPSKGIYRPSNFKEIEKEHNDEETL